MRPSATLLRAALLLGLVGAACQRTNVQTKDPDTCLGARCVEEAEAAIWEGEDAKAREPLTLLCEKKDAFQCFRLAQLHEEGRGGPVDLAKAAEYYETSCQLDYSEACEARYRLAAKGEGGPAVELEYAKKACDGGIRLACTRAGDLLHEGSGVPRDDNGAAVAYEKGCGLGDPEGCIRAGDLLFDPKGPWEKRARSLAAYLSACTGYNPRGCVRSGVAFYEGIGVDRSTERALTQFKKACDMSDDDGCSLVKQLDAAGGKQVPLELTATAKILNVTGVQVRGIACRLAEQGDEALTRAFAGIADQKLALDACAPDGAAVTMSWKGNKGKVQELKIDGAPRPIAACISAALRKAKSELPGPCKGVVLLGNPEAAVAAYEKANPPPPPPEDAGK
ncbi:MAG TPA: tetratricopeptide repeat protein [Nannocystaceae bacterium]|nr:tetratricopeptide repeat protein [Nannocystaceae bacterium]